MIIVALGANVPGPWGTPPETLQEALKRLDQSPCKLIKASTLIETAPFGVTDQPNFVNGVATIATKLAPQQLMAHLHDLELQADRRRTLRWGPRTLDLDLIDYDGKVLAGEGEKQGHSLPLVLPHPGIAARDFVLKPLAEIAPNWHHPITGKTPQEMLDALA